MLTVNLQPPATQTQALVGMPSPLPAPAPGSSSTDVILAVVTVFGGATLTAIGWVFRSLATNYNDRFRKAEEKIDNLSKQLAAETRGIEEKIDHQERNLLVLRAELPVTYTRSEDFIRFVNMLDAKIDSLHRKIDGAIHRE